mmetsp:Transcript_110046/g.173430  ORF Transcript_110046/g.173430 Transcript_110046/m.173430 type:complete len:200 (+) Transcript_110046:370-969(+)
MRQRWQNSSRRRITLRPSWASGIWASGLGTCRVVVALIIISEFHTVMTWERHVQVAARRETTISLRGMGAMRAGCARCMRRQAMWMRLLKEQAILLAISSHSCIKNLIKRRFWSNLSTSHIWQTSITTSSQTSLTCTRILRSSCTCLSATFTPLLAISQRSSMQVANGRIHLAAASLGTPFPKQIGSLAILCRSSRMLD